jgi:hypothetical protein
MVAVQRWISPDFELLISFQDEARATACISSVYTGIAPA